MSSLAWMGAVVVGVTMGLLGSGGSILSVPILVYVVGVPDKVAIAESLAIVGVIASFALIPYARRGLVQWPTVFLFGVPGMAGAYFGAALARFVPGTLQLVLFALVMLAAAAAMLRSEVAPSGASARRATWKIALDGMLVGVLTGLVGVGGGFLIVPALVLLGGLPVRHAIGTSLAVIALKSSAGYVKYLDVLDRLQLGVDWSLILLFAALGIAGSVAGGAVARWIPQARLKQGFAAILVAMSVFILIENAPDLVQTESSARATDVAVD